MNKLLTVLSVILLTLSTLAIYTDVGGVVAFIGNFVACVGLMMVAGRADAVEQNNANGS